MTTERPTVTEWTFIDSGPNVDSAVCVFLHGFMGGPEDWTNVTEHLSNYRCLRPRIPAVDADPGQEQSAEALASSGESAVEAAAEHFISKLPTLSDRRVHLVGYSMGARIALAAANIDSRSLASLTLVSGSPGIESIARRIGRIQWDRDNATKLRTESLRSFLESWYQMPLFRNLSERPLITQKLIDAKLSNDSEQLARQVFAYSPGRMTNYWPLLSSLQIPVLALAGAEDAKYQQITADLVPQIPDVRTRVIPGAGHVLPVEAPEAVAAHCHQFIQSIEHR